jgi:hypothetical protein
MRVHSYCEIALSYVSWNNIKTFLNSHFFTAVSGSLAGAFAGAYIAQRIAKRNKNRDELLLEIRNTNSAISLSLNICNSLIKTKKQNIKPLKDEFSKSKAEINEVMQKIQTGEIERNSLSHKFTFKYNLQFLPVPWLPTDALQNQIFEKISIGNRPFSAFISLLESTRLLQESIKNRNQLIEQYKVNSEPENPEFYKRYFGLPYGTGHVDLVYLNLIDNLYSYCDDAIFFSHLLCTDLIKSGEALSTKFKQKFGNKAPSITTVDFTKSIVDGLIPSNEVYINWLNCFVESNNLHKSTTRFKKCLDHLLRTNRFPRKSNK